MHLMSISSLPVAILKIASWMTMKRVGDSMHSIFTFVLIHSDNSVSILTALSVIYIYIYILPVFKWINLFFFNASVSHCHHKPSCHKSNFPKKVSKIMPQQLLINLTHLKKQWRKSWVKLNISCNSSPPLCFN